jgi:hypothetical protein
MKDIQPDFKPACMVSSKFKPFFILSCLLLFAASFAYCSSISEKTIVAKIVQAYGGKDALARVSALTAEGKITTFMPKDEGTYFLTMKRNRKLLVDIKYTKRTEKRILNGNRGYSGSDKEVTEVTGSPYEAMVYQYNQLDLPSGLLDGTFRISYLRKDNFHGRSVYVMKLTDRSGNEVDITVDNATHYIVKTSGFFVMGGEKAVLSSELSDFRKAGGVVFPFTIVNYADGFKISETWITKYTVNPDIGDAAFSP